jgi:hypothetical protein
MRWRWTMLREWMYWKKHCLICNVVNTNTLAISSADTKYDYTLEIGLDIEFQNGDDYPIKMKEDIWMEVENRTRLNGLVQRPYELHLKTHSESLTLPPLDRLEKQYQFRGYAKGRKPSIDPSPKCKVIVARIKLQELSKERKIESGVFRPNIS